MKLYIFNQETTEIVVIVNGETNEACEAKAEELDYDLDLYAWSYATGNELFETAETKEVECE
jgi:hypothetical protein